MAWPDEVVEIAAERGGWCGRVAIVGLLGGYAEMRQLLRPFAFHVLLVVWLALEAEPVPLPTWIGRQGVPSCMGRGSRDRHLPS